MNGGDRLVAESACARLLNLYAAAQDSANAKAFAEIFSGDAVWERPGRSPINGRDAIYEHARETFADDQHRGVLMHCISNILIDIHDETTASSRAYSVAYGGLKLGGEDHAAMAPPLGVVIYENQFRAFDGVWKIARHKSIYQLR